MSFVYRKFSQNDSEGLSRKAPWELIKELEVDSLLNWIFGKSLNSSAKIIDQEKASPEVEEWALVANRRPIGISPLLAGTNKQAQLLKGLNLLYRALENIETGDTNQPTFCEPWLMGWGTMRVKWELLMEQNCLDSKE